jgi:hypothetical protein
VTITVAWPSVVHGVAQQGKDLAAGRRVQVARRLVGEHHRRAGDERAGDGHALLLAARELGRAVAEAVGQADLLDEFVEPLRVRLAAGQLERQGDVLGRGEHREQVEELEDEADVVAPQAGERGVVELGDVEAGDGHVARRGLVQTGEDVHQRRLARARRAHHGGQVAGGDVDADAAQGVDGGVAGAVAPDDVAGADDGRGRDRGRR